MKRFWNKVQVNGLEECWPWLAARHPKGRGKFSLKGKAVAASRVAYELTRERILEGLHVLHSCDNPGCCNPTHLFLGTNQDNIDDKVSKGRQSHVKGTSNNSAKLTESQVIAIRADTRTQRVIAKAYGIGQPQVGRIKRRTCWEHVS